MPCQQSVSTIAYLSANSSHFVEFRRYSITMKSKLDGTVFNSIQINFIFWCALDMLESFNMIHNWTTLLTVSKKCHSHYNYYSPFPHPNDRVARGRHLHHWLQPYFFPCILSFLLWGTDHLCFNWIPMMRLQIRGFSTEHLWKAIFLQLIFQYSIAIHSQQCLLSLCHLLCHTRWSLLVAQYEISPTHRWVYLPKTVHISGCTANLQPHFSKQVNKLFDLHMSTAVWVSLCNHIQCNSLCTM